MHFTKTVDASSPNLFIGCATGKHFPNATVTVRRAGEKPQEYLVYKLTEVYISSITTSGHEGGGIAQESVSLNFSKVEVELHAAERRRLARRQEHQDLRRQGQQVVLIHA